MKRISISVTDWQAEALEEIASREETSIAHVVRDALRATLPRLREVVSFLNEMDEHNGGRMDPEGAQQLLGDLDGVLARFEGLGEGAEAGFAGAATPPPRRFTRPIQPPSGNTGAQQ